MGADGIEFDVQLARDGVPVVVHDLTLKRLAGLRLSIKDLTSQELSKIDVGSWFDKLIRSGEPSRFTSETVPSLAQVLEFLDGFSGRIFVELKSSERDTEQLTAAVCGILKNSHLLPNVILKGFRLAVVTSAKVHIPGIRTAALFAPKMMTILRKEKHLVEIAEQLGADELSIHFSLATRKLMGNAMKRGLPVTIWTANSPRWVKRAYELGIKSIITDDPSKLLERRRAISNEHR